MSPAGLATLAQDGRPAGEPTPRAPGGTFDAPATVRHAQQTAPESTIGTQADPEAIRPGDRAPGSAEPGETGHLVHRARSGGKHAAERRIFGAVRDFLAGAGLARNERAPPSRS